MEDVRRIEKSLDIGRFKTKTELKREINDSKKRLGGTGMSRLGWQRFRQLFLDKFVESLPPFKREAFTGKTASYFRYRDTRTGRFIRRFK